MPDYCLPLLMSALRFTATEELQMQRYQNKLAKIFINFASQ